MPFLARGGQMYAAQRRSRQGMGRMPPTIAAMLLAATATASPGDGPGMGAGPGEDLFRIGEPDGRAAELGLTGRGEGYGAYLRVFPGPIVYTIGKSHPKDWPHIHPARRDLWAGGRAHPFAIRFESAEDVPAPLYLVLGLAGGSPNERSNVAVLVNGAPLPVQRAPAGDPRVAFSPRGAGVPASMVFAIPPGLVRKGPNEIVIRLDEESWIIYDYVALRRVGAPLPVEVLPDRDLLAEFLAGPMAGVEEIVFAVRPQGEDPHWYANFGPTLDASNWRTYLPGGRLAVLEVRTGKVRTLIDDPEGGIRDPAVRPDGRRILFSWRKGSSPCFHLHEIRSDGAGLRQLTDGPFDDIEPAWLPDGDIIFCSSRCRRRVNCHTTMSAILYRCGPGGGDIRPISSSNEPDNTPWPLPSGEVLYTRWEYVDRDQMAYHHLWKMAPGGERQLAFFGNGHPGTVIVDAKPIPGSPRVVAIISPGHGLRDHDGALAAIDPRRGPDDLGAIETILTDWSWRDPWAFAEGAYLAASGPWIVLADGKGEVQTIFELPPADAARGLQCHEPRPLVPRTPPPALPSTVDRRMGTGTVVLLDVRRGRRTDGIRPGEVKSLLVLETLPKPMNYTGGMEPMSYGGTFTLERILGTVPVEPDGSAHAELPALRSLVLVALDGDGLAVKRMQSFLTVMPGETTGCIGCHERRTDAPPPPGAVPLALRRPASRLEPIPDVPGVIDYPRDVQPILDRHCLPCHDDDRREGGLSLSGDRGPIFSISYYSLTARDLVADGRNGAGNRPPRTIGSGGSRLLRFADGNHHEARPSERERKVLRLWIDSGAAHPGTYAALGTGMVGGFEIAGRSIRLDRSDLEWPGTKAAVEALERRCGSCHTGDRELPLSVSHVTGPGSWGTAFKGSPPWVALTPDDVRRKWSRHLFFNLTRPKKSLILLAPLARSAGGFEACGAPVFAGTADEDYRKVLAAIAEAKGRLDEIRRFDMSGFQPRREYVEEMRRHGILPAGGDPTAVLDVYALDRAYWEALEFRPEGIGR
jgi:hypothetical protein